MIRRAKLHDNEVLEFPGHTTDEVVDATVRRRLGEKYPARMGGIFEPGVEPIPPDEPVADALDTLAQVAVSLREGQREMTQALGAVVEAVRQMAAKEGADSSYEAAVREVSGVKEQITLLSDRVSALLTAKKRLIFDAKGEPVGVETVE
jgi:cell pole-organizing protein PopZ